jgi:group I intron endonuclease
MKNIVYITTNLINGKQYVGDHSEINENDNYLGSGNLIIAAVNKYGRENFNREILEVCESKEAAFLAQEKYIKKYNTLNSKGYNISPKGGLGVKGCHTEETKHKISESNIGKEGPWKGKKNEKHSEWMKNNNPFKGKKHTNETKEKIGVKNSKPKSEEHKKKISESLKGNIPGNIVKIEIEGTVYESLTEASEKLKLNYSTLRNRIKSKSKKFINYKIL